MNDFERQWRYKIKRAIEQNSDSDIVDKTCEITCSDPVVYSRTVIDLLRENLSENKIQEIFSHCACHMPVSKLQNLKNIYKLDHSLELAHNALQKEFEKDIVQYKQLSNSDLDKIIENGWGAAGILFDDHILTTKIPSRFHEYFLASERLEKAYYYCHCPRVKHTLLEEDNLDSVYCYCGGGFYKNIWETITSKEVQIEVVKNLFDGDDVCQFKVRIQGEHY